MADDRSAREIARREQRDAGDHSAKLANTLMKLGEPAFKRLAVDDDLREAIARARKVTSLVARRRAERALAGDLRRADLDTVDAALAAVHESAHADAREFQLAEKWRTQLIEGVDLATFPGGPDEEFPRLIAAARKERDSGKPPGAARALFRHIVARLKA